MNSQEYPLLNKKRWIFPLILILLGAGLCFYVVKFPKDRIVSMAVSYGKIGLALKQHIYMVVLSSGLAILTSVPLGVLLTRKRFKKIAPRVVGFVNIGQTVPSLAVVALCVGFLGIGARAAILALWIYSLLPILRNTITGIMEVDDSIVKAAAGMGLRPLRMLTRIEIPLAMPIILAGIRTAITINIGTAILGGFVGAGGFGDLIITGNNVSRWQILIIGASIPALMAIIADHLLGIFEEYITF